MKSDVKAVLAGLENLGSANGIAAYLDHIGQTGRTGSGIDCPIAHYLQKQLHDRRIGVGPYCVHDARDNARDNRIDTLPKHIAEFISNFDHGDYPHLISAATVES